MTETRIGCAGWSISTRAAAPFPAQGSQLERYGAVLNAVEINSSFYRPHQPQTYEKWAASVPDDFRFAVKLPKSITHERRLADADDLLARFAGEAGALGPKLGCVLVQLPPSLKLDVALAQDFFTRLRRRFATMVALEARNPGWFDADATALLKTHGVTRVIADPPAGQPGPHVPTTEAVYVRLHGSPKIYVSLYAEQQLRDVADTLAGRTPGSPGWCIFDNTMTGLQPHQALRLRALLARE
ncbi:DUF72 domain-containing protein [Duganella callida]|uniref:DUF72 domain-containing protein n=1 Tax=Duganella callida TaxID=2561932 RepID=A0A4Y9STS5_9BURK|nr:DUF72 domain-containing protein [Duganella callida]TFW30011.1 DUF72 domain-containing protein [Duganella callida]